MYTVIWNPRFTLNGDNNGNPTSRTTFFDFRSKIIDRASQHTDEYWIVRPHPRAFAEYLSRGVLTRDELNQYISSEAMPDNGILDVMYTASSWDEAMSLLEKLKNGTDPLAEKRKAFAAKLSSNGKSGQLITEFLINDYTNRGKRS